MIADLPWRRRAPAALALLLAPACGPEVNPSDKGDDSGAVESADPPDSDDEATHSGGPDSAHESADPCAELHAVATRNHSAGRIPFNLELDGADSCGPAPITNWEWTIDGEALEGAQVSWTGLSAGTYEASLTVTDETGATATTTIGFEVLPGACPTVLDPVVLGALANEEIVESSGLLVSQRDEAVLWTHNDSGDTPRLFAMARDGSDLGTWTLDVALGDWEDLAWGVDPATGEPLIFAGDIGNNGTARETVLVYILSEPEVDPTAAPEAHAVASWATLSLRLPELLNLDSMLVDPVTGDLYLFSDDESTGRAVILRKPAPHADGDEATLEEVGELSFGAGALAGDTLATGAAISPLGDRIVLRTRDEAWLWPRDGAASVAETLSAEPCPVPLPAQTLGETVAFDPRHGGLLLTSEGVGEPIYHVPFYEEPECIDTLEAVITATPPGGPLPLEVVFDASESCVPEGLAEAHWDIDGEEQMGESVTASWLASGSYPVTLTLIDNTGAIATASTTVVVEPGDCPTDGDAEALGTITDAELVETSGVTVSRLDPDVLWVHNDSGHAPQLFALDRTGATLGTWTLDATSNDFEDIAAGYAEDGTPELWIGDVGDNFLERDSITVYRLDEPEIPGGDPEDHAVTDFDILTLTWPDGPRNCETLMVDPVTRDLYLVSKDTDGESGVYRKAAPHIDGESAVLELVASLSFGSGALAGNKLTTGGEFSPDGAWIVVRTYATTAFIWPRDRSATVDDAFAGDPCPVTLPTEVQGEAICFDTEGDALISTSERASPPIYRVPLER